MSTSDPPEGSGTRRRLLVVCRPRASCSRTAPTARRSSPSRALTNVDFPAPDGPRSAPVIGCGSAARDGVDPLPGHRAGREHVDGREARRQLVDDSRRRRRRSSSAPRSGARRSPMRRRPRVPRVRATADRPAPRSTRGRGWWRAPAGCPSGPSRASSDQRGSTSRTVSPSSATQSPTAQSGDLDVPLAGGCGDAAPTALPTDDARRHEASPATAENNASTRSDQPTWWRGWGEWWDKRDLSYGRGTTACQWGCRSRCDADSEPAELSPRGRPLH